MGLLDMGLTGVFDAVYGASAGAINATYFLTGVFLGSVSRLLTPLTTGVICAMWMLSNVPGSACTGQPEGLDIYTDHLAPSDRFLSLKRYWGKTSAPVMNLDFLLDEVMHEVS